MMRCVVFVAFAAHASAWRIAPRVTPRVAAPVMSSGSKMSDYSQLLGRNRKLAFSMPSERAASAVVGSQEAATSSAIGIVWCCLCACVRRESKVCRPNKP